MVEQLAHIQQVVGSQPARSTKQQNMGELIFNIVFSLVVIIGPLWAIIRKVQTHKSDREWEEIKRQNSEKALQKQGKIVQDVQTS